MRPPLELVCPAGSLPALKAAIDHGADAVYVGFRDATNARNFPGLNFDPADMQTGLEYVRRAGKKLFVALNTYPLPRDWARASAAVDTAAALAVDAVIVADIGLLDYCSTRHPGLRRHLSVQGSATNADAIAFYVETFDIKRAVLPRVLSLAQVARIAHKARAEIEVFGFGSLCVMVEGRCALSSFVTGASPNTAGVCSSAKAVRWEEDGRGRHVRLNGVLIDTYAPDESAGYPTLCKGRFQIQGATPFYALEEPTCLNVLDILPRLHAAGVAAIKVEGRQRSPAYVAQATATLRRAVDACNASPDTYRPQAEWIAALDRLAEGRQHTLGALDREWQ